MFIEIVLILMHFQQCKMSQKYLTYLYTIFTLQIRKKIFRFIFQNFKVEEIKRIR